MLIDHYEVESPDPILRALALMRGETAHPRRITQGIYEIGHFGSSTFLPSFNHWPELTDELNCYGVCDHYEQILNRAPSILVGGSRRFVITLCRVRKETQEAEGGWRWKKWGPYIGTQEPTTEFLYDEPVIQQVFVYHIYEKKETK
jgi:hypothetical protein